MNNTIISCDESETIYFCGHRWMSTYQKMTTTRLYEYFLNDLLVEQ